MPQQTVSKIAELNDQFRKGDRSLGICMTSEIVSALSVEEQRSLFRLVRAFDEFSKENDPYEEHDFGSVEMDGEKYFWKICYYDVKLEFGSPDSADPNVTRRVLTVMHHLEY